MRVQCLVGAYAGEVRDFPHAVAKQLLKDGRASPVRDDEDLETTTVQPAPEATVRRRGRPPGSKNKRKKTA